MQETFCLICGPQAFASELHPATYHEGDLTGKEFAARKTHRRIHYRIVKCKTCGLIRSDPILEPKSLHRLYEESDFGYLDETQNLGKTYMRYFQKFFSSLSIHSRILEIGCGNGFFLYELWKLGFRNLKGYEPSVEAIKQAPLEVKNFIIPTEFRVTPGEVSQYDVICSFHTIDHLERPDEFVKDSFRLLKSGGYLYNITHDAGSLVHKIFGEHSVMFDIQHIYMFSRTTLKKLLIKNGYASIKNLPVANTFSLAYFVHMSPLPKVVKKLLTSVKLPLTIRVGNMAIAAQKP